MASGGNTPTELETDVEPSADDSGGPTPGTDVSTWPNPPRGMVYSVVEYIATNGVQHRLYEFICELEEMLPAADGLNRDFLDALLVWMDVRRAGLPTTEAESEIS